MRGLLSLPAVVLLALLLLGAEAGLKQKKKARGLDGDFVWTPVPASPTPFLQASIDGDNYKESSLGPKLAPDEIRSCGELAQGVQDPSCYVECRGSAGVTGMVVSAGEKDGEREVRILGQGETGIVAFVSRGGCVDQLFKDCWQSPFAFSHRTMLMDFVAETGGEVSTVPATACDREDGLEESVEKPGVQSYVTPAGQTIGVCSDDDMERCWLQCNWKNSRQEVYLRDIYRNPFTQQVEARLFSIEKKRSIILHEDCDGFNQLNTCKSSPEARKRIAEINAALSRGVDDLKDEKCTNQKGIPVINRSLAVPLMTSADENKYIHSSPGRILPTLAGDRIGPCRSPKDVKCFVSCVLPSESDRRAFMIEAFTRDGVTGRVRAQLVDENGQRYSLSDYCNGEKQLETCRLLESVERKRGVLSMHARTAPSDDKSLFREAVHDLCLELPVSELKELLGNFLEFVESVPLQFADSPRDSITTCLRNTVKERYLMELLAASNKISGFITLIESRKVKEVKAVETAQSAIRHHFENAKCHSVTEADIAALLLDAARYAKDLQATTFHNAAYDSNEARAAPGCPAWTVRCPFQTGISCLGCGTVCVPMNRNQGCPLAFAVNMKRDALLSSITASVTADRVSQLKTFDVRTEAKEKGYSCASFQILNQKSCGTCWAHAAATAYSQRLCKQTHGLGNTVLSPSDMASIEYGVGSVPIERHTTRHSEGSLREDVKQLESRFRSIGNWGIASEDDHVMYDERDSDDELDKKYSEHTRFTDESMGSVANAAYENMVTTAVKPEWCRPYICRPLSIETTSALSKFINAHTKSQQTEREHALARPTSGADRWELLRKKYGPGNLYGTAKSREGLQRQLRSVKGVTARDSSDAGCNRLIQYMTDMRTTVVLSSFHTEYGTRVQEVYEILKRDGSMVVHMNTAMYREAVNDEYQVGPRTAAIRRGTVVAPLRFMSSNHEVVLVGWGTSEADGDYWTLINSWGENWNGDGTLRVRRGFSPACYDSTVEGLCELDFLFSVSALGSQVLLGPGISESTLSQIQEAGTVRDEVPCLNNGELLADGSCHCRQPWGGDQCNECVRQCNNGSLDSTSCTCTCPSGQWGHEYTAMEGSVVIRLVGSTKGGHEFNKAVEWADIVATRQPGRIYFDNSLAGFDGDRDVIDPSTLRVYVLESLGTDEFGMSKGMKEWQGAVENNRSSCSE